MKILQAIGNIPEVLDGVQMGTEDVPKGPQRSSITQAFKMVLEEVYEFLQRLLCLPAGYHTLSSDLEQK